MFDLEKSIKSWLRLFQKHRAFNHGAIREMELHLRDHIDDLLTQGYTQQQAFDLAVKEFGEIKPMAKEAYWSQRPKSNNNFFIHTTMLKNYFKIAVRNFIKHKFYTFVNVLGLTVGLSTVFMIGLFVSDELGFDQFHEKKELLYRVVENQYYDGQPVFPVAVTPDALGPSLYEEYPEIVHFTRASGQNYNFQLGDLKIAESNGYMVDEQFFEMFSFPIIKGTAADFKEKHNTLILTKDLSDKYFPDEDPIGKSIKLSGEDFVISAVMENVPKNSHLYFTYLTNFEKSISENPGRATNWRSNGIYTYVELSEQADLTEVNKKVINQIKKNSEGSITDIYLQPITDIYLGDVDFVVEVSRKSQMIYVQIFSIVAVFILLISCINFMNLSTARSAKRAKEVGLRKTIGAQRSQLIFQFLSESVLLTMTAVLLSVLLVALVLPSFNQLANKDFVIQELLTAESGFRLALGILLVAIATGLIAGSYPALFLSSTKPIDTLNAQSITLKRGAGLRKALVIFQFIISIVLVIGTIAIYQQLSFIQNVDLGYNKENIIYTSAPSSQVKLLTNELRGQPGIINVGRSSHHPAYVLSSSSGFIWPGQNADETFLFHYMGMDEHYPATMEMNILEGRSFLEADTATVMINEKAKAMMGLENPVGQTITAFGEQRIVGVIEDFNFKSIHSEIEPMVIFKFDRMNRVYVKYEPSQKDAIVATLENSWNKIFPEREFSYDFLEEDFQELYEAEQRTSTLSTYFAILAIIVSCLGLFGLVSYAMEQRMREIGIRKVLGASVSNLFVLLTGDFTKLILISLVISMPLGWYAMNQWLNGFAYHIELSIGMFVLSAFSALVITLLTVSYQSIRASTNNPVRALRNE